jgi:hypothetical protein
MSIQRVDCYLISCSICRSPYETNDGAILFWSADEALSYVTEHDGWTVTESGNPICSSCTAGLRCARDGHDYSPWHPCHCAGRIPEHALFGCGLFRFCHDCDHHENATLATLPTIEDPRAFGC